MAITVRIPTPKIPKPTIKPKEPREEIRVLGIDKRGKPRAWRDSLPVSVLLEKVGEEARYAPETWAPKVLGMLIGAFVLGAVVTLGFMPVSSILAGMFGIVSLLFGGFAGWFMGPKFGPKPFWKVRYHWDGDTKVIVPYIHSRFNKDYVSIVDPGEDQDPQVVGVHRASMWYHSEKMRDEAEDLTPERTTWEKIETASLGLIAVGLLIFLFFFIAIMNGAEFQGNDNAGGIDGFSFGRAEEVIDEQ